MSSTESASFAEVASVTESALITEPASITKPLSVKELASITKPASVTDPVSMMKLVSVTKSASLAKFTCCGITVNKKNLDMHIKRKHNLKRGQEAPIERCTTCCSDLRYHCPFCTSEVFRPNELHHVKNHVFEPPEPGSEARRLRHRRRSGSWLSGSMNMKFL